MTFLLVIPAIKKQPNQRRGTDSFRPALPARKPERNLQNASSRAAFGRPPTSPPTLSDARTADWGPCLCYFPLPRAPGCLIPTRTDRPVDDAGSETVPEYHSTTQELGQGTKELKLHGGW